MQLEKEATENRFEEIENKLERLSLQIIVILKEHKKKGIIGEDEYKKHTEYKKDFLAYLDNKRQGQP